MSNIVYNTLFDDYFYNSSRGVPYTEVCKNVCAGYDFVQHGLAEFVPAVVCDKLKLGEFGSIHYDLDSFLEKTEENKKILNCLISYLLYTDRRDSPEIKMEPSYDIQPRSSYGKLTIYFRRKTGKNLEKFFIEIANEDFLTYDELYLRYFFQFFCILFETNYYDEPIEIERGLFNVMSRNYMTTSHFDMTEECDNTDLYVLVKYEKEDEKKVGYELRFSVMRPNSKIVDGRSFVRAQQLEMEMFNQYMTDLMKVPKDALE